MLTLHEVCAGYGRNSILQGLSLEIGGNELVTILGPNGAGKSTLMATVMGLLPITSGAIYFEGERIDGLSTREIVQRGICLGPEKRHLFPHMTIRDNIMLGGYAARPSRRDPDHMDRVFEMFPTLKKRGKLPVGMLSGGEQQMVVIGRALASKPKMLLLDEPSLGLAPIVTRNLIDTVAHINREESMGLCLVEQNAELALNVATRGYVMGNGVVTLSGTSAELRADPRVRDAYLGGGISH